MNNPLAQPSAPESVQNLYNQIWSYSRNLRGYDLGPTPKLNQGTGRTGAPAQSGYAAMLPAYVSKQEGYQPQGLEYQESHVDNNEEFNFKYPRSINVGVDGIALLGTYRAHDFTVADRFSNHFRHDFNWQQMAYPATFTKLIDRQQVQQYQLRKLTKPSLPLTQNNYFLGYYQDMSVARMVGGSNLGQLGGGS